MRRSPHALLQLNSPASEPLRFRLELDGRVFEASGPPRSELRLLEDDIERVFSSTRFEELEQLLRLADRFARQVLPASITERLKEWASNHTQPVYVAVCCHDDDLVGFPWELLPVGWRAANVQVVRLAVKPPAQATASARPQPPHLLAVGWPDLPGLQLPGIERELTQLPRLLIDPNLRVSIQMGPTYREFCSIYRQLKPTVLHFVPPGITRDDRDRSCLLMAAPQTTGVGGQAADAGGQAADAGGQEAGVGEPVGRRDASPPGTELVRVDVLAEVLREHAGLRLIVLNTCHGGREAAGQLTATCQVTTVGWIGFVPDELAADFAAYFHQRVLEGKTVAESVFLFLHRFQVNENAVRACLPVVWLPDMEALQTTLMEPPDGSPLAGTVEAIVTPATSPTGAHSTTSSATASRPRRSARPRTTESPADLYQATSSSRTRPSPSPDSTFERQSLEVRIELEPALTISPALLKNGRPAIRRLSLFSSEPAPAVRLEVFCDAGFGSSVFRRVQTLHRGAQPIQENIQFPVLFELSDRRLGRRRINFTARISNDSGILAEETRSSLWMGHNEWMDREDTWPFIPSFVFPNCDAVRQIFDLAMVELRKIGTPKDNFVGYQRQNRDKVHLQMRAVFQTLRDLPLDYINPPAAPIYLSTEQGYRPGGQLVRFPSEVLQYRRGTCHDLALLVASCAEHIGIYPLIVLAQGHTFCGYWTDPQAHEAFWSAELSTLTSRAAELGDEWLIRDAAKLGGLVESGSVTLVEATRITRDDTFEMACHRFRSSDSLQDARLQAAIDVWQSRRSIQPL